MGGDADGVDGGADTGSDATVDGDTDGPVPDGSADGDSILQGEVVAFAATELSFTMDRVCDLDGDGAEDNAVADLGESDSGSASMLLDARAAAAIGEGYGPGLHFLVLDDNGVSRLVALSGDGATRGGTLRAPFESLDGCGEPRFLYEGALVTGGRLNLTAPEYPALVNDGVAVARASVTGLFSTDSSGVVLETEECLAASVRSLGGVAGPSDTRGLTMLEVVLAGGGPFGMPRVPGLSPDVDLDGDGLERVLLDDEGHVQECVDGDRSVIAGRECWNDDRMADAISMTRRVRYEEAAFAGRIPSWMGFCEEGYADPSVFGEEWNVAGDWQVSVGEFHSCMLNPAGAVRCWGTAFAGQLGYGNMWTIGDDEPACVGGIVDVGEGVLRLSASIELTCAILAGRRLKCWGNLGAGLPTIGDDETPASAEPFELGAPVEQVVVGMVHHCALLSGGRVRCWGAGEDGLLGHGNTEPIDSFDAALAPDVPLGGRAVALAAGYSHTCAIMEDGGVRCWGLGDDGVLGYGNVETVGDDETPEEVGDVALGGAAVAIEAGVAHTCVILAGGGVRCWGIGSSGRLGHESSENIGDDESPIEAGDVPVGGPALDIAAGAGHTCVILDGGLLRCWGRGVEGQLGYGNTDSLGDDEPLSEIGFVDVGGPVVDVDAGAMHTCAVLQGGAVRCWGFGGFGALGYGNVDDIGDDETPASAGDVPVSCD